MSDTESLIKALDTENLIKEAETLIEALEALEGNIKLTQGAALEAIDQSELAQKFLTDKAVSALSKKATTQVVQTPDTTEVYTCIYLSVMVKTSNIEKGVEKICNSLNTLADKDLIHSTLAVPSSIKLAKVFGQAPTSAVYSFVLVPMNRKEESEKLAVYALQEGDMGNAVEDLSVTLGEGEFLAEVNISCAIQMLNKSSESLLHKTIQKYLNVLPEGTELVEIVPCTIMSLSLPYEVRFRNPLMKNYKEVRLGYMREAVIVDDKIEQFSLLTDIEYIKKETV